MSSGASFAGSPFVELISKLSCLYNRGGKFLCIQTIIKPLPRARLLDPNSIVEGKLLSEGNKITKWYNENLLQLNDHQSSYWSLGLRQINKHKPADIDRLSIEQLKSFIDKRYVDQILVSHSSIIIHLSVKLTTCLICWPSIFSKIVGTFYPLNVEWVRWGFWDDFNSKEN